MGTSTAIEHSATAIAIHTDGVQLDHVGRWLLAQKSKNTRNAYRRDLEHVATFIADTFGLDLYDVEPSHIDAYRLAATEAKAATSTINRRLSSLSAFYAWVIRENIVTLDRNPAHSDYVKRDKASSKHAAALTTDEMRALIAAARDASDRDLLVVLVLAHAGLRVTELVNAKVSDLRDERGHCTLSVIGKGNKKRSVVMPPEACEIVDGQAPTDYLINNDGAQLNRHQVTRILARLQRAAGIRTKLTPHVLRATMVTEALDAGVELWVVQDTAGHSDSRTTRAYQRRAASLDKSPTYALASRWA